MAAALPEKLDSRLCEWRTENGNCFAPRIAELIDLADHDVPDLARSHAAEQVVLDMLDDPAAR